MKVLTVFAFVLATAAAANLFEKPVFLKDLVVEEDADAESRITNGYQASVGQFPYQVGLSLLRGGYFWCGATLIGNYWVLTAAHCTDGVSQATVYLGSTTRTVAKVQHTVDRGNILQHAGYNPSSLANDISLIRIPYVAYSSEIQPVNLPAVSNSYPSYEGYNAIPSGWGRTSDSSSISNTLLYTRLPVISNQVCQQTYGNIITGNTLCVATPSGSSTCQGDSGGPLVLDGTRTLIGVTSFVSSNGCKSGAPAGFARVTTFRLWIRERTGI